MIWEDHLNINQICPCYRWSSQTVFKITGHFFINASLEINRVRRFLFSGKSLPGQNGMNGKRCLYPLAVNPAWQSKVDTMAPLAGEINL